MGLEQFMDLEPESNDSGNSDDNKPDDTTSEQEYKYNGNKQLLDVEWSEIKKVVQQTDNDFKEKVPVGSFRGLSLESQNSTFFLTVHYPWEHHEDDCVLVSVLEANTGYDVIEPYPIYFTDGWKKELEQAIDETVNNKEELVQCKRCGSVMIIRETNTSGKRIRGCSSYPECKNKEIL